MTVVFYVVNLNNRLLQNPLLSGGDLSTMIERVPQGNSSGEGYSKYHNRGGVCLTNNNLSLYLTFIILH